MTDHPIVPPPELLEKWSCDLEEDMSVTIAWDEDLFCKIARWGADKEFEACYAWLQVRVQEGWNPCHLEDLRNARRGNYPAKPDSSLANGDA